MTKLKVERYKGFEIEIGVYKESLKFYAECLAFVNSALTSQEAIDMTKSEIDEFLEITPKDYDELAKYIYDNCVIWKGYEDCYVDAIPLEVLIRKFIVTQEG